MRLCHIRGVIFGSYNGSFRSNAFAFFAKFFPEIYGVNTPPALGHTGCEQAGVTNSFPYDTRVDLVCEETQASWSRFGETSVCGSISNAGTAADDGVREVKGKPDPSIPVWKNVTVRRILSDVDAFVRSCLIPRHPVSQERSA